MSTLSEIERVIKELSAAERAALLNRLGQGLERDRCVSEPPAGHGSAVQRRLFTFEEYLEIERGSPLAHEYVAGEIFSMSEPSQAHEIIAMNLATALHAHLRGRPCRTYAGGRRLHFKCRGDEIAYYPDVWVGCGESRNAKGELEDEARLVIEIVSPSTARIDRREKAINYREITSLQDLVLVEQKPANVVLCRRADDWRATTLDSRESMLELRSVGLLIPVGQVYEGVP